MSDHELAQLNIGVIKGPMDSPLMADFAANLERINAVAEAAPGFVWRLQTEEGDATAIRPFENEKRSPGWRCCAPRGRAPRRLRFAVHFPRRARHRTNLPSSLAIAVLPRSHLCHGSR